MLDALHPVNHEGEKGSDANVMLICYVAERGKKRESGANACWYVVLQQEANGQLFVDDYHSFRYKQGAYGLITYSFTSHKLHSK